MTELETRTLARASILLLVAAGARWGWESRRPLPLLPVDSSGVLPRLLREGEVARADDALRGRALVPGERLDPNRASDAELDRLPGVGPSLARALVASREAEGPFLRAEDLTRVRGLGPATAARLAERLTFPVGGGARPAEPLGPAPSWARLPEARSPGVGARGATPEAEAVVDLNRADARALERLPGVGPALAERILALRARKGRFGSVEELLEVRGIGPATLARLRGKVGVR